VKLNIIKVNKDVINIFIVELRSGGSLFHKFNNHLEAQEFLHKNYMNNGILFEVIEFKYHNNTYYHTINNDDNTQSILHDDFSFICKYDKSIMTVREALEDHLNNWVVPY